MFFPGAENEMTRLAADASRRPPAVPAMGWTAHPARGRRAEAAIEAMKQGAYDYLFKPLDLHQLRRVVSEALEVARRMRQPAVVADAAADPDVEGAIVGGCPAMREVYKAIGRVAGQD